MLVAGVVVAIEADDDVRMAVARTLFGGCERSWEPAAFRVVHRVEPPPVPRRTADDIYPDVEFWLEESGVASRHGSGVCGRRVDADVDVGGWRPDVEPVRAFRLATQLPVIDALRFHGLHTMHAAALERRGQAVVVLGGSGAGKSTLAYAGSHAGWNIIADDLCAFEAGAELSVVGFPKPINVPSELFGSPPAGAQRLPSDGRDRWALASTATVARGSYPVRAVVSVAHGAGAASCDPVPASPVRLQQLVASLPLAPIPSAVRGFFPVAALLSRLPTYRFQHAADPAARIGSVVELLGELALEFDAGSVQ